MEYAGNGNQLIIRLNRGEEVVSSIAAVCEREQIDSASVTGIGAVDYCKIGIYHVETREYTAHELRGEREMTALTGNISMKNGERYFHFHVTVSGNDLVSYGGHLNEARISATAEIYVTVFAVATERIVDGETGLNLLAFPKKS